MLGYETIPEIAKAIRSDQLTILKLAEHCLRRIEQYDHSIRAWATIDPERVLTEANQLSEELAQGKDRGILHGIPIGIKDIIDVAGYPTMAGSRVLDDKPVEFDAEVVTRLKNAGALIMGKTVTAEFACFDPPPTRNPWNVMHTPGGSSSGSAAAVAAEMCVAAIGSQTGGSIIRPSSYCGLVGCKPTLHRVSTSGVIPVSFTLDHIGPIARRVTDAAVLLRVMSADRSTFGLVPHWQLIDEHENLFGDASPPKIGMVEGCFKEKLDSVMETRFPQICLKLERAGAKLIKLELPELFKEIHEMHHRIMAVEAAEYHEYSFHEQQDLYGKNLQMLILKGLGYSSTEYAEALYQRREACKAIEPLFEEVDVILTPATPGIAPASLETTGDPRFNSPWAQLGLPAVSVPFGVSRSDMPIAMQLIGKWGQENQLFKAAHWVEQLVEFNETADLQKSTKDSLG